MLVVGRPHLEGGWRATLAIYFVLEILWSILWFVSIIWVQTTAPTVQGLGYRSDLTNSIFHITSLMMLIYATSFSHRTPDTIAFIVLVVVVLFDVQMVVTTALHSDPNAVAHARNLQFGVVGSGLALSTIAVLWYACYWAFGYVKEKRKVSDGYKRF